MDYPYAFQAPSGSQASSRGEAKDSALLSSRDAGLLEPPERYFILWPPHAKTWLIGKDSDAGRDWGQEEKGTTGDEMAGWHHRLDGHEFEQTPGDR